MAYVTVFPEGVELGESQRATESQFVHLNEEGVGFRNGSTVCLRSAEVARQLEAVAREAAERLEASDVPASPHGLATVPA